MADKLPPYQIFCFAMIIPAHATMSNLESQNVGYRGGHGHPAEAAAVSLAFRNVGINNVDI
jgi:hypothetical protein